MLLLTLLLGVAVSFEGFLQKKFILERH